VADETPFPMNVYLRDEAALTAFLASQAPVAFGRIKLSNIATVMVHGRNELHLKFNNDTDLRDAYAEITKREAAVEPVAVRADALTDGVPELLYKAFSKGIAQGRAEQAATQAEAALISYEDAHETAWQAAAAFRPSYFGDNFIAHNWVVEAVRSAHMDGQRFALGLPKINRARGGELPQELRKQRTTPTAPTGAQAEPGSLVIDRFNAFARQHLKDCGHAPHPLDAWVAAEQAAPKTEPVNIKDELELIWSVLQGYPRSMAQADALRTITKIRAMLATPSTDSGRATGAGP
jgi:hypothetical protein